LAPVLIAIGLLLICLAAVFIFGVGRVYIGGSWGFIDGRKDESAIRHVDEPRLIHVIERLLSPDPFDLLWVSRLNDKYTGLTVIFHTGTLRVSIFFNMQQDSHRIEDFRAFLDRREYIFQESSNGFSGGFGARFRQTHFEVEAPSSAPVALNAVIEILTELQPGEKDGFFIAGHRLSDSGSGIKFGARPDPLAGLD